MKAAPITRKQIAWALGLISLLATLPFLGLGCGDPAPKASSGSSREYLFCFWNVENLFDDQFDGRTGPGDKEHDGWHAKDPAILKLKLDHLCDALLKLNGGKGPDILAFCEVESVRAAQLLQKALNARLDDAKLHYQHVLMKNIAGGRHIAPGILTRLDVTADRTRTHGSRIRILEGRVKVDGHELIIVASHWTSRLNDGSDGRAKYADQIYGVANAVFKSDPKADVLICGDFNDTPSDPSVTKHLKAGGDRKLAAEAGSELRLFNLMAGKDAKKFGTHYYSGWFVFDQIVVTPGMLNNSGWSAEVDSVQTVNTLTRPGDAKGRPWRFGSEKETAPRGFSDHFPVTVKLKVHS